MASSFTGRENRRWKASILIMEHFSDGEWFTVHDIMELWARRWVRCLTEKELCKTLPALNLEFEFRPGHNYKFYRYIPQFDEAGNLIPLYTKRPKP